MFARVIAFQRLSKAGKCDEKSTATQTLIVEAHPELLNAGNVAITPTGRRVKGMVWNDQRKLTRRNRRCRQLYIASKDTSHAMPMSLLPHRADGRRWQRRTVE